MNIVFLTKYFPPDTIGGGEISAYYLARALVKRGHNLTVIKRGLKDISRRDQDILIWERKDLFNREVLNWEKKWAQGQAQILKKDIPLSADIIHAQDFHSTLILSELKALLPDKVLVTTVRDFWPVCGFGKVKIDGSVCPGCVKWSDFRFCPKVRRGNIIQKFIRTLRYRHNIPYRQEALSKIDKVVYISKGLKEEILKSENNKKPVSGFIIYNPIPSDWEDCKSKLGNQNLLFAGLLDIHKGFGVLLEALGLLKQKKCDFSLVVAGTGQLMKEYKRRVQDLGLDKKINFLGRIPHNLMRNLYCKSDVVIAPSLWPEPFGRSLIEGMLIKKAVIGTDHGAPQEFIQNGKTGLLVEPNNSKDLADKIILLLKKPSLRKSLGEEGRKYVLDHFDPNKIAKQYEYVYKT